MRILILSDRPIWPLRAATVAVLERPIWPVCGGHHRLATELTLSLNPQVEFVVVRLSKASLRDFEEACSFQLLLVASKTAFSRSGVLGKRVLTWEAVVL